MVLDYEDYELMTKLSKLVAKNANERQVLATLKDIRYKLINDCIYNICNFILNWLFDMGTRFITKRLS